MSNSKRHTKIKVWGIKIVMIFCFSISAIALSNGALYLQKVIFLKNLIPKIRMRIQETLKIPSSPEDLLES
ncbi:hypothetical protein [Bacillus sp. 123MFChir2]|uniref:hypothetical protein n=1 Tax=Bacillus sp. 123MFChir2 TaxID=1169144 RepID=UPI0009DAC7E0|nr:hypothetical protein [Bacillus sp. 123MFChir2]